MGLLALLPGFAAAVPLQGVVDDVVVVGVFPCQDAGSTGAAQWAGNILWKGKNVSRKTERGTGETEKSSFLRCLPGLSNVRDDSEG